MIALSCFHDFHFNIGCSEFCILSRGVFITIAEIFIIIVKTLKHTHLEYSEVILRGITWNT